MDSSSSAVRVRVAPSPTGDPHVGTAYAGLLNYVFARKNNGKLILRIEDTDQTRSTLRSEHAILDSLKWFGIEWDEGPDIGGPHGPYRQSERTEIYQKYTDVLLNAGGAYRCFCTPERLDHVRQERRAAKLNTGYDRACRDLSEAEIEQNLAAGIPYVLRLKMPIDGETIVPDRLRGDVHFQNDLIDDQILIKSDGFPTYHFANVIDDHLMGITHVIRAEEWLISTPKHLAMYHAFGWRAPEFIHFSLLRNRDKSKISKRKNPVSLIYYQEAGFRPEALCNFLGLMGWNHPSGKEQFSLEEMIEAFSLNDISLGGPIFDLTKLKWLNGLYIRDLSHEALGDWLTQSLFARSYLDQILPLVRERMEIFDDFWKYGDYFYREFLDYDVAALVPKKRTAAQTRKVLNELMEQLELATRNGWTSAVLEATMREFCEKSEWIPRDLFMTVRLAVTGKVATPPLFETMEVLGKERVRQRFLAAGDLLKKVK